MSAPARQPPLVQHQDLVCIQDGADPLGDNELGGFRHTPEQSIAKGGVRPYVQGREAVVENKHLGPLYQRPGDGQALPLPAGKVGTALGYRGLQAQRQFFDKVLSLGDTQSLP